MILRKTFLFLFFISGVMFTSCRKDEIPIPAPVPIEDTVTELFDYIPVYENRSAILVAINNYNYKSENGLIVEKISGSARAVFPTGSGFFQQVGTVAVQDVPLELSSGNRYALDPTVGQPEGINFINASTLRWSVSGNENFPPVSFICLENFPSMSEMIMSKASINRNEDFTFGTEFPIDDADSVFFNVFAPNGYLFAHAGGARYNHTFTREKLSVLKSGHGFLRITAFKTVEVEINGQRIQYLNECVNTQPVTIY